MKKFERHLKTTFNQIFMTVSHRIVQIMKKIMITSEFSQTIPLIT